MLTNRLDVPVRSLFTSLLPDERRNNSRFVWLSNFDAERFWASSSAIKIPSLTQPDDQALVNRLEEMTLLLAEDPDVLILREPPDPAFSDYLGRLGFRLPHVLSVCPSDKSTPISEAVLANESFCRRLAALAGNGEKYCFLPYARTRLEERIIEKAGLQSMGPSTAVCERVNCKIYGRTISKELGLTTIEGRECESISDLQAAFEQLSGNLCAGEKLVLKEAMGVSGKGLVIIDSAAKFQRVLKMLQRGAKEDARFAFVLEVWVEKTKEINYQVFISETGEVRLLTLKEIIAKGGVHLGHRFPVELTDAQAQCYRAAAQAVGRRLFEDGFTGIAGIDSIIDRAGVVYPVLEINARFNMSTYQLGMDRLIEPESKVVAKHYPLLLRRRLPFDELSRALGTDLFASSRPGHGVVIQNYAAVNVNFAPMAAGEFKGRLYALLVGGDIDQTRQLDQRVIEALGRLEAVAPGYGN